MNRREFMRRVLGGATAAAATAAVAGMALPMDLRPDDHAVLMTAGISYEWDEKTQTLRVMNHTQHHQLISGVFYGDLRDGMLTTLKVDKPLMSGELPVTFRSARIFAHGSDGMKHEWSFEIPLEGSE